MKKKIAKWLWNRYKSYCYIEAGKDIMYNTPWFRITIFGEEVARLDYSTHEILHWRYKP